MMIPTEGFHLWQLLGTLLAGGFAGGFFNPLAKKIWGKNSKMVRQQEHPEHVTKDDFDEHRKIVEQHILNDEKNNQEITKTIKEVAADTKADIKDSLTQILSQTKDHQEKVDENLGKMYDKIDGIKDTVNANTVEMGKLGVKVELLSNNGFAKKVS